MAAKKNVKTLEQTLWEAADKLRGNQEPSEYKHVVLGLVFLKYVSDRFEERRLALQEELADDGISADQFEDFLEDRDEYTGHNVFWVPEGARWSELQAQAKQPEIGQLIDRAMQLIERENPSLRGVLPRNYGREGLDKKRLGELVDLIGTIGFSSETDHGSDDVLGSVYEYFLGQFAETPRDTIFTTEYSVRSGMESVYTLCDVDRGVPEVFGSVYDVRTLMESTVKMMDGETPLQKIPGFLRRPLVKFLDKTVIGEIMRRYNFLSK